MALRIIAHPQNGNTNVDVSTNFCDNETSSSDHYDPLGLNGSEVEVKAFEFALFFNNISLASPEDSVVSTANEALSYRLKENFPKMIANIVTVKNNLKTVTIDLTNSYLISPNDPDSEYGPTEPRTDLREIFKTVGYICNASQCGVTKIFLKLRLPTEAMRLIWEKKSQDPLYLSKWAKNSEDDKWFSLGMLPHGSLGEVRFLDVGYEVFKAKGQRLERTAEYEAFSWEMQGGGRLLTVGRRDYYQKKREIRTDELRS